MRETENFIFFYNGLFSQWFFAPMIIDGVEYTCCEQYMMAEKARLFNDQEILVKILEAKSPARQKKLGRQIKNFDKEIWNQVCRDIVYKGNYAKFTQNKSLMDSLEQTKGKLLVEASPYDCIWGIGLSIYDAQSDSSKWKGTNWLGEAITKVRKDLFGE